MMTYKQIFAKYWDVYPGDFIPCLVCGAKSVDIHHVLFKSQGGKDNIENLAELCRSCHTKAHNSKQFNERVKEINDKRFTKG